MNSNSKAVWQLYMPCQKCAKQFQQKLFFHLLWLCIVCSLFPHSGMWVLKLCRRGEPGIFCHVTMAYNQNRTRDFRTEKQHFACCSTNYAFNTRCAWYLPPDTCSKLPTTFALFPNIWILWDANAQIRSVTPFLPFTVLTSEKYQAVHGCTTSMFVFQSVGTWERVCIFLHPTSFLAIPSEEVWYGWHYWLSRRSFEAVPVTSTSFLNELWRSFDYEVVLSLYINLVHSCWTSFV